MKKTNTFGYVGHRTRLLKHNKPTLYPLHHSLSGSAQLFVTAYEQCARVDDVASMKNLLSSKGKPGDIHITRFVNKVENSYTALQVRHCLVVLQRYCMV